MVEFNSDRHILALSGGVGGSKLALGLSHCLTPQQLSVVVNTADDFEHLGLHISPDLDTLMYTLSGLNDTSRGWGLADESWAALDALARLGEPTWFQLGDRDLATHLARSHQLKSGSTLSAVTAKLCASLGIAHPILPMTDDTVRSFIDTASGMLSFQEYFVAQRCAPETRGIQLQGIESARPQIGFQQLLRSPDLGAIVIGPSNPFVSIDPIIKLAGIAQQMRTSVAPVVAVSPIIDGDAVKGPAAKMMAELGMPVTAASVAAYYGDLLDGFVIDQKDAAHAQPLRDTGLAVLVVPTMMQTLEDRRTLARQVVDFSLSLSKRFDGAKAGAI